MTTATVVETARVERLTRGDDDHDYGRHFETLAVFRADRRREPRVLLSEWLHDNRPETGTYRLLTSWGARSDEVQYRSAAA